LDLNLALFTENGKYYVQTYSFGGLQGDSSAINQKLTKNLEPGNWQKIEDNVFFQTQQNLILYKNGTTWNLLDFSEINLQISNLSSFSDKQLLILDKNHNLWLLDKSSKVVSFLAPNFLGLFSTQSPDNLWLMDNNNLIYRLNRNSGDFNLANLKNNLALDAGKIFGQSDLMQKTSKNGENQLEVSSLFLGLVFRIGDNLVYVQDADKSVWQILSNSVNQFSVNGSSAFWLDQSGSLFTYNLLYKDEKLLGKLDLDLSKENIKLFYYPNWRRLMVYTPSQVYSVWVEVDVQNVAISAYYPNLWIKDDLCLPKVDQNYQFCVQDNKFITYKNNSITI
jgi:hypothetical protein